MENTLTNLHPDSFLAKVVAGQPLRNSAGQELIKLVPSQRWHIEKRIWEPTIAKLAAIDNGNDGFKGAMPMKEKPYLATVRIPTAYSPWKEIRGGSDRLTWQVNNGEKFWLGADALATKKAENLPVGLSHERLTDVRFQRFLAACQVELLVAAGYGNRDESGKLLKGWQGDHDMYVAIGLPPEEVDRTGTKALARQALRTIFNVPFNIERTDEEGATTNWRITFVEFVPYGQTFGSFAAWYYTPDGTPIPTDIEKHITLDVGGGQFHACEVELEHVSDQVRPKLRMSAAQIGEGTIVIARGVSEAIRSQYYNIRLSDPEAQEVLVRGTISVGGRKRPVDQIVQEVIASRADNLNSILLRYLQDGQSFLMFTGGGSILLYNTLHKMVSDHRLPEDYFFVPSEVSNVLNAIGGVVIAQSAAQKVMSRPLELLAQRQAQQAAQQAALNGQK
jgi:hypothetical protein